MMFSRLFGGSKLKPEDFEKLLAQARRHLWRNEIEDARQLFERVRDEIKKQSVGNVGDAKSLADMNLQTQLGLWAISYLRDSTRGSAVRPVLDRKTLSTENVYFIARVFQAKRDLSPEALTAYQYLLEQHKSAKTAHRIAELLKEASFSNGACDLLETVVELLPQDRESAGRLCCWQLYAGHDVKAGELASQIIRHEPDNLAANRTLGIIAERHKEWETAAKHYRAAGDHLRRAVVLAKAGNLEEADKALEQARPTSAETPTWLYYRGWIAYQQHDIPSAVKCWVKLREKCVQRADRATSILEAAQSQWMYDQIQSPQIDTGIDPLTLPDSPYQAMLALKIGAARLLLAEDHLQSRPLLQRAAQTRRNDATSVTYLLMEHALEQNNQAVDKQIYVELLKHFQDASLFLWLRGLTMLRQGRSEGQTYLLKAYQEGLCERHMPAQAVQSAAWLAAHLYRNAAIDIAPGMSREFHLAALNDSRSGQNEFLRAIMPSYMLEQPGQWRESERADAAWSHPIERASWQKVLAAHYLVAKKWNDALSHLHGAAPAMKARIVHMALQDAVGRKDWMEAASYVKSGLEISPDDPALSRLEKQLKPQMNRLLWEKGDLGKLELELESLVRAGNAPTVVYHDLAIVYTQLAILRDNQLMGNTGDASALAFAAGDHRPQAQYTGFLQDKAHNSYWLLAIGYWAVTLSDEEYWLAWSRQRSPVYGEPIAVKQIHELTRQAVPRLLREYHEEKALVQNAFTTHHRFYASIIAREIELTNAIRYLIRIAGRQQFTLPPGITRFISPLLIKEHGYNTQARDMAQRLGSLRLSPYEADLIQSAFSPLSDVKALVALKEYDMALLALRTLKAGSKPGGLSSDEMSREHSRVLKLAAQQQVDLENWEKAMALIAEAKDLLPSHKDLEDLQARATIGLANQYIREQKSAQAVQTLERARNQLSQKNTELDTLLCEVYVEWGQDAADDDDTASAQTRFERALQLNKTNERARQGLAGVFHNQACDEIQAGRLDSALACAEKALSYFDNPKTHKIAAIILHDLGVRFSKVNERTASTHFRRAYEQAKKQWDQEQNNETLHFLVDIGSAYVLSLYSLREFLEAIRVGEDLMKWRVDYSTLSINLPKLISAIYTDYGAQVYNNGNYLHGKQLMQKALVYDPTNQAARNNLHMI